MSRSGSSGSSGGNSMPPPPANLPSGWSAVYSDSHGRQYFVNLLTGRSTWDLPTVTAAEEDNFMRPIRNRNRIVRSELRFSEDDPERAQREREFYMDDETRRQTARSRISPSQFEEADPRRYVSGNFFRNIGVHFPQDGRVSPHSKSFVYFKRTIKEQGIFCEKMDDAEVLDIAADVFIYDPRMNVDPITNKVPVHEYRAELESIRRLHLGHIQQAPSVVDKIIDHMDWPRDMSVSVTLWKMLLYAKTIQERCEGTCAILREDPREQSKAGSMIVSDKQKGHTKTTCGFTAPSIAVATLFLQVMGSEFLDAFRKHSKCSVKTKSRSRSKTPAGVVRGIHDKKTIYTDEMLSQRLATFDSTLSVDEPRLYAKLNTAINQLYDNNREYKTGINYMYLKRPDLFVYSGLKLGINIISVVQSGVTLHHSFIYNMGHVSVIMDSWAHGDHRGYYVFGREVVTRMWVTAELERALDNLHPGRSRTYPTMKNTIIRVFLAPHADNIRYYPQFIPNAVSQSERRLYFDELKKNDQRYDHTDYTIISINQNFLMSIFSFNFGFTNDILFGGGSLSLKSKSPSLKKRERRRRHAITHKKI